jgi:hypothetical protein
LTRTRTPALAVVSDEDTEAPAPTDDEPENPTQEVVSDEEMYARIQQAIGERQAQGPKKVTVGELFQQAVALVASSTGKNFRNGVPTVSEQSAVKLYELTLMWALNQRGETPSHDILDSGDGSDSEEAAALPIPTEFIGEAPAPLVEE